VQKAEKIKKRVAMFSKMQSLGTHHFSWLALPYVSGCGGVVIRRLSNSLCPVGKIQAEHVGEMEFIKS
jgi:hypothetical protein